MLKSLASNYSIEKDGISQSLMSLYMQCPRKFAIATHGISSPSKFVMELGSAGHSALENDGDLTKYEYPKTVSTLEREQIAGVLEALIPAYRKHYEKEDKGWKHNREQIFDYRLSGARIRGKMDSIMTKLTTTKIRETKFKARISEDGIEKSLALDWQSLFYMAAYTQVFKKHPKGGVEYDVVRYPTIKADSKPKALYDKVTEGVQEDPGNWFKRWETKFDPVDVMTFTSELLVKLQEIKERKVWYRNECNCFGLYACNYIGICTANDRTGLIDRPLFSEL